jgi:NAD(P)H dehydrogenase (quinone)
MASRRAVHWPRMRVLSVFVHPSREGFCGAVHAAVVEGLEAAGHEVRIADLYAEGFDPRFGVGDYAQFDGEPMPDDVLREQARVEWSEALVIVTPIWWWQYPAMLKGWIDRVFSEGWAFRDVGPRTSRDPLIGARPTLVVATAGGRERTFARYGYGDGIRALWDVGIWGYCGFHRFATHVLWDVEPDEMSPAERAARLDEARALASAFPGNVPVREPFAPRATG